MSRYAAAACQTDMPDPLDRRQMRVNTDRMLSMIDSAVAGSAPFLPVRLVVFPGSPMPRRSFKPCRSSFRR
jgi:hypothetical protein